MTPQGVAKLITAAAINKNVAFPLKNGYPHLALRSAKINFPEDHFDLDKDEMKALGSIKAESVADFAKVCNHIGLTKEG